SAGFERMILPKVGDIVDQLVVILDRKGRPVRIGSYIDAGCAQVQQPYVGKRVQPGEFLVPARHQEVKPPVGYPRLVSEPRGKAVQQRVREQPGVERLRSEELRQTHLAARNAGIQAPGLIECKAALVLRLVTLGEVDITLNVVVVGECRRWNIDIADRNRAARDGDVVASGLRRRGRDKLLENSQIGRRQPGDSIEYRETLGGRRLNRARAACFP